LLDHPVERRKNARIGQLLPRQVELGPANAN
jgi:hypothetical protein